MMFKNFRFQKIEYGSRSKKNASKLQIKEVAKEANNGDAQVLLENKNICYPHFDYYHISLT